MIFNLKYNVMKKFNFISGLIFIAVAIVISGCDSEDDSATSKNYFSYDGKEYAINNGYFSCWGEYNNGGPYVWGFFLTSDGLYFDSEAGDLKGKGDAFMVNLVSSSETEIVEGTYSFDETDDYLIDGAVVVIGYDIETEEGIEVDFSEGAGTIDVKKTGEEYEVIINCKTKEGKEINGYFKGSIPIVEFD